MAGTIDSLFELADAAVDAFDATVPRDAGVEEDSAPASRETTRARRESRTHAAQATTGSGRHVSRAEPSRMLPSPPDVSTGFRVLEVGSADGVAVVVTDGVDWARCSSRAFAERIRGLLG